LERTEVKAEKIEKDHEGHNSGGVGRVATTKTSLDDESSQSCNSNSRKLS